MKITSSMFLNVILLTIVSASFFLLNTTAETANTHEYDPWVDLDDDGDIDLYDAVELLTRYGSKGTPINKTALLLELMHKIDTLNATIIEQQNTINYLNETVVYLNETVTVLNRTGLGAPDYDSGWQSLSFGQQLYLTHNLNTTDLLVYFIGRYESGYMWTHQYSFGGQYDSNYGMGHHGAWWAAEDNTIILYRAAHDFQSGQPWNHVRVMIWKIPEP